ncbi:MAG: acyl-ACP--UDP-N-acetylglucosamine O-acyltransferase [Xanthomonadales bacterium]|nr:Acyl-[acyl-carrier-protein]--UDP-N-acetylglucosamine O-acyltransferase [Xanthomonadales bacterium]MCC6593760.1 acyl-ACP--UDP-N-acetylglucosamine O-acyltransferase [Xanthomonadales bacterium]MCE7930207.1 acyl-ACP--UDP-N-acetylglucosamine O-acyltransferase [Xanthomonadales bacterium PRO6]
MAMHASAIVDAAAELDEGVEVGAYTIIGAGVRIGAGTRIGPHCVIEGPTTIGRNNHLYGHAAVGGAPQDKKYAGEPTALTIGDGNTIREFVTISRGTVQGGGVTRIGDDNWIMAYVHIAHDCIIGSHTILANSATLAGHVTIQDHAILGGFSLIHQFCKIGAHAFTGMGSKINCDVPPYVVVGSEMSVPRGINAEGLKRRGFTPAQIAAIKRAYKTLYLSGLPLKEAREQLATQASEAPEVAVLVEFIDRSERSILR